jgi:Zn-dependent protease with chaperone function
MSHLGAPAIPGPADREAFFTQQARYRRQTWRLSALCAVAILVMGVPLSVVISPFVWCLAIVAADILNLFSPTADLFRIAFQGLDRALNSSHPAAGGSIVWLAAGLIVPGIVFMMVAWLLVRAILFRAGARGVALALGAREPRGEDLDEQQLRNVVEEMAIAAGLTPVPDLGIVDDGAANAGAFGRGPGDATIVVSRGLLEGLDREETEGVVAQLVASIGNGDLHASMTILSVVEALGLVSLLLGAPTEPRARSAFGQLVRLMFRGGAGHGEDAEQVRDLLLALEDASDSGEPARDSGGPGHDSRGPARDPSTSDGDGKRSGWIVRRLHDLRDVMQLPFVIGQAAFWMNQKVFLWLVASPLIAFLWRARRYLADATAVQLTRYPDGLANALIRLSSMGDVAIGDRWSSHLFVIGRNANPIDSLVSFDAPLDQRLAHLVAAGATITLPPPRTRGSRKVLLVLGIILIPLLTLLVVALFAAAITLVYVALAIYMLFLFPMIGVLHWLLHRLLPQWLAGGR